MVPVKITLLVTGFALIFMGALMAVPIMVDPATASMFGLAGILSVSLGGTFVLLGSGSRQTLRTKDVFLLTTLTWLATAAAGGLPFLLYGSSFTDSFFESISGITTTGSTIFTGLDDMPRGILLWRSMLHWVGGLGVIVTAIAVLPMLKVGGMQLFRSESSDKAEKELASAASYAAATFWIYFALSALCALAYSASGMNSFDAINHAMATLSTGGFSTHDQSMGFFQNPSIHWTAVVFMLAGSLPFVWYIRVVRRGTLWSEQVFAFLVFVVVVVAALTIWVARIPGMTVEEALRHVAFNVVSVMTTTGFASTDYTLWGSFAIAVFFMITFAGGCTGSTSGGVKVMRNVILLKAVVIQARRLSHPHGVFRLRFDGRPVDAPTYSSLVAFVGMFGTTILVLAVLLNLTGLDFQTSLSGAATAVANVGPGLGPIIGPAGNFQSLPDVAKWLLAFGMLLGRLEIMTVLVLFTAAYWRD